MALGWLNTSSDLERNGWVCGYCGREVGGSVGYKRDDFEEDKAIYICPHCENPTAFLLGGYGGVEQFPKPAFGREIDGLPSSVEQLYGEVRRCVQCASYTSAVLSMRKLLMHVAVEQGANPGKSFAYYVSYLDETHWIPPNGREWVDAIRKAGNEAPHEITISSESDAKRLLDFTEMLLKIVYEFPSRFKK